MTATITNIEVVELHDAGYDDVACAGTNWTCLVLVHTDVGITGIGEVNSMPRVIRAIVDEPPRLERCKGLKCVLLGRDAADIEGAWETMYRESAWYGRRGVVLHAIGAIDMALWDIAGKVAGQPLWQVWGPLERERVRAYGTIYPTGHTADEVRLNLDAGLDRGLRAFKICADDLWRADLDHGWRLLEAARRHVGSGVDIALETVWVYDTADELLPLLPVAEEFDVAWIEAPLPLDDLDGHARLVGHGVPIAAGDNGLTTRFEFRDMIDRGQVDIVQPSIAMIGGFTEMARLKEIVRSRQRRMVVYGFKSSVTDAANLHLAATHWADEPIEYGLSSSQLRRSLTAEHFDVGADGRLPLPEGPGLGVSLDSDALRRYSVTT